MLRLVHPAPEGQAPVHRRGKGYKPAALYLTPEECQRVRAALRNTAMAYGGNDVLAVVMGIPVDAIYSILKPRRRLSGTIAIRLAQAAGVSVEAILTGKLSAMGRCPTCGSRIGGAR